jgi:hypothetical protein
LSIKTVSDNRSSVLEKINNVELTCYAIHNRLVERLIDNLP